MKNKTTFTNNTYFLEHNKKFDLGVEVGDSKQKDIVYPQFKVKKWDNECNVSFRLIEENYKDYSVKCENDHINFKKKSKEIKIYEIEDGFEFEIDLLEKPETNLINFSLNTKGLEFFYQPELTQEEKDNGAFRPENVIGSYAVYTSEEKINYVGGKEYKAGKVGHIYRPKISDSDGNETWGELSITGETLSVTIPQDFIDNAVYPIKHAAGLTFGYTTQGSSETAAGSNRACFSKNAPSFGGSINSIYICVRNEGGVDREFKSLVCLNSDGTIVSNGISPTGTIAGSAAKDFYSVNYSSKPTISASTNYLLGYVQSSSLITYYDTGSAGDGGYQDNSYSSPTDLSLPLSNNNRKHSIYADYTAQTFTPQIIIS